MSNDSIQSPSDNNIIHLKPTQPVTLTLHNAFDPETAYQRDWVFKHLSECRVAGLYHEMGWQGGTINIAGEISSDTLERLLEGEESAEFTLLQHPGSHLTLKRGVNPTQIPIAPSSEGTDPERLEKNIKVAVDGLAPSAGHAIETGHDVDWLKPGAMKTSSQVLKRMLSTPAPQKRYLIKDFLAEGETAIFIGETKVGKSFLLAQLAVQCAIGGSFCRFRTIEPVPVIYLNAEDPPEEFHYRLKAICDFFGVTEKEIPLLKPFFSRGQDNRITGSDGRDFYVRTEKLDLLAENINALNLKPGIIILDTLSRFHGGEENNTELRVFVEAMEYLVRRTGGWSVITTHHPSQSAAKNGEIDPYAARGGTVLVANTRRSYMFAKMSESLAIDYGIAEEDKERYRMLHNAGSNYGSLGEDIWFERQKSGVLMPVTLHRQAKGKAGSEVLQGQIISFIAEKAAANEYLSKTQLFRCYSGSENDFGVSKSTLERAVANLLANGELAEIDVPSGANLYHGSKNVTKVLACKAVETCDMES